MIDFFLNSERKSLMIDLVASLAEESSMMDYFVGLERESLTIGFVGSLVRELLMMDTIAGWKEKVGLFVFLKDVNLFLLTLR